MQFNSSGSGGKGVDFTAVIENFRLAREQGTPRLNLALLRQFWQLTIPFWTRRGAWPGYIILALYTASSFMGSLFSAATAKYAGSQLEALSKHDSAMFYKVILISLAVQVGSSLISLVFGLPYQLLMRNWQLWMTKSFVDVYLRNGSHYLLNRERIIDNPDERIAADIQQFLVLPSIVLFGVVGAISNLAVFGYVLWHFAWYLVPLCAAYYIGVSLVQLIFSKPIMILGYAQRRLEGDFRFALVNVRVNSESIAFLRGEAVEQKELDHRQDLVIDNAVRTVWWNSALQFVFTFTFALELLIPGFLIAPLVLRGTLSIGAFPQAQNAWSQLGSAFGFVGQQSFVFAFVGAMVARLHALRDACVGEERAKIDSLGQIRHVTAEHVAARNFTLETPKGERVLVKDLSFEAGPRCRMLITGVNGIGKSSLLRGFAGLWTRGAGTLELPPREKMMFLPQRPYMSLGSLREQVTYPAPEGQYSDEEVREVMRHVQLGDLEERVGGLDVSLDWRNVLSPGEQQRLAFARALVRKPELMILDEATASLDVSGERLLYGLLKELGCSYISVAHRVTLYEHHDTMLELLGDGKWRVKPVEVPAANQGDGRSELEKSESLGSLRLSAAEGMGD